MDLDRNGLIDGDDLTLSEQLCFGDLNQDEYVNSDDDAVYMAWYLSGDPRADMDGDRDVDAADSFAWEGCRGAHDGSCGS